MTSCRFHITPLKFLGFIGSMLRKAIRKCLLFSKGYYAIQTNKIKQIFFSLRQYIYSKMLERQFSFNDWKIVGIVSNV